jgi:hypothetical protein
MTIAAVYNLVLSVYLAKAIKKLISTLFSLQIIVHMFIFSIPFPGNIVNIIKKLKPLVSSFDIVKDLTKFYEKFIAVDTLKQIEFAKFIIPSFRGMVTL